MKQIIKSTKLGWFFFRMGEPILWVSDRLCTCHGKERANRVVHPSFPDLLFCKHNREKRFADFNPRHTVISLSDSKFNYDVSVDTNTWKNKLGESKEKLYFIAICSKITKISTKKELLTD